MTSDISRQMKSDEKWAYMMYHGIIPLEMSVEKNEEDHIFIHFDTYVLEIPLDEVHICPILFSMKTPRSGG